MSVARYHISPSTGNPNKCSAQPGNCPYATDEKHYDSKEAARAAYEQQNAGGSFSQAKSTGAMSEDELRQLRLKGLADQYSKHSAWSQYPAKPSGGELRAAAAYAQLNRSFAAVGYSEERVDKALDHTLEYDHTGSDFVVTERRVYTVATPTGEFVKVTYEAAVGAEYDDYWEYHPSLQVNYKTYSSSRALAGDRPDAEDSIDMWEAADATLRYEDPRWPGSSELSYSHADESDTRRASHRLMAELTDPYAAARAARLKYSKKRIKPNVLEGNQYLTSPRSYVREALAARKELPRSAQEKLSTDGEVKVRYALAQRSDLSAATVKTLLGQGHVHQDRGSRSTVREALLANPALTPTVQKREAAKGSLEDLKALARNTSLSSEARSIIEKRTKDLGVQLPWGRPFGQW